MGNCLPLHRNLEMEYSMRFLGNISAKSDNKGRFFLPAAFRKVLQAQGEERLVLRKDIFQDCLVVYPEQIWNARLDELNQRLNKFNASHQQVLRQFVAHAEPVTLDSNGRLLISRGLLQLADIQDEVHFIGMDDVIEIWASHKLEQPFMDAEELGAALGELMK